MSLIDVDGTLRSDITEVVGLPIPNCCCKRSSKDNLGVEDNDVELETADCDADVFIETSDESFSLSN